MSNPEDRSREAEAESLLVGHEAPLKLLSTSLLHLNCLIQVSSKVGVGLVN